MEGVIDFLTVGVVIFHIEFKEYHSAVPACFMASADSFGVGYAIVTLYEFFNKFFAVFIENSRCKSAAAGA